MTELDELERALCPHCRKPLGRWARFCDHCEDLTRALQQREAPDLAAILFSVLKQSEPLARDDGMDGMGAPSIKRLSKN